MVPLIMKIDVDGETATFLEGIIRSEGLACEQVDVRIDEESGRRHSLLISGPFEAMRGLFDKIAWEEMGMTVLAKEVRDSLERYEEGKGKIEFG